MNILQKIKTLFLVKKYKITIEKGFFDIVVHGNLESVPGKEIIVERSSSLSTNKIYANIKVIDSDKNQINSWAVENNLQWRFYMPESDIRIIPIIKRKRQIKDA